MRPFDRGPECPHCESHDTELFAMFGQQLLTVEYYCNSCRTPFGRVRDKDVVEDVSRRVRIEGDAVDDHT